MSNVTSLELSKELYTISGWRDTSYLWHLINGKAGYVVFAGPNGHDGGNKLQDYERHAYDLGYLLRKLPYKVIDDWSAWVYGFKLMPTASTGWKIWYGEVGTDSEMYFNSADTPEDAAAKLCIELFKQNILTREKE